MIKFYIYKGKYAFSRAFFPLFVISIIPYLKNGLKAILVPYMIVQIVLIHVAFSDIAVKKIPNVYNLILGII